MLAVLRRLASGRDRAASAEALSDFLAGRAAFVSQKCTFDYCRARAGIGWAQLFKDDEFGRALMRCRWEAYAAVLADIGEVALVYLRHQGGDAAVAAGLGQALRAALERHPVPAHRTGWEDALETMEARLHRALMAAQRAVHRIGRKSGGVLFEVLPIHTNLKAHDREMVVNNVRFLLCRVYADMERELDGPALVRLLSEPAAAPGSPPGPR
jgi:hypothetical protein